MKTSNLGRELRAEALERTNEILARPSSFASHGGPWRRLGRLRGFDDLLECVRIADGQIRQDLAIDGDVGLGQPGDELRVGNANLAGGGVDTHDPQTAEIALPLAAVKVGETPRMVDGLDGCLPQFGATTAEAFG